LGDALTDRNAAFGRLAKRVRFKNAVHHWVRVTEVPVYDDGTCHPHFHIAAWVDGETYHKGAAHYIEFEGLRKDWRECLRVDYDPVVRIERIRSLRECAKYTTKTGDYVSERLDGDGYDGDPEKAALLYVGLKKRRLISWSASLRALRAELGLLGDDADDDDLTPEATLGFPEGYKYVGDEHYAKAMVTARTADFKLLKFKAVAEKDTATRMALGNPEIRRQVEALAVGQSIEFTIHNGLSGPARRTLVLKATRGLQDETHFELRRR
jgi:hypothetical protein